MGSPLGLSVLFAAMESTEKGEREADTINDTVEDTEDIDDIVSLVEDEDDDDAFGKTEFSEAEAEAIEKFLDDMPNCIPNSGDDEDFEDEYGNTGTIDICGLESNLESFIRGEYHDFY